MAEYNLSAELHQEIAQQLYEAEQSTVPITHVSKAYPGITMDDAYAIQKAGLELRQSDGARIIGRKIGITSKGMMEMLNCDTPDYGCLFEHTQIPAGMPCHRNEFLVPIIEGELAFVMKKDLDSDIISKAQIVEATDYIAPCFEVCDSRYGDWNIQALDAIADNGAAARFMLGISTRMLSDIEPASIGMTMKKNGQEYSSARGSEVMGSPINSVVWLANKLHEYGDCLRAGDIVLSGSFMAADRAEAGDSYTIFLQGFYPLTISFM